MVEVLVEASAAEYALYVVRAIVEAATGFDYKQEVHSIVDAMVEVLVEANAAEYALHVVRAIVEAATGFDYKEEWRQGQTPECALPQAMK